MAEKRRYGEGCGVSHALDLIGERWSLLIVRDLLLGPKRFTDLQAGLPGAGPNILARRLRELQEIGVVRHHTLPPPAGSKVYELTEWGAELDPVLALLGRWGTRSPIVPVQGAFGHDSVMLALRNFFVPQPDSPWTATYDIRLGQDRFTLGVVDGSLVDAVRGQPPSPDVIIETDAATLGDLMMRKLKASDVAVTGDVDKAQRLFDAVVMS